MSDNHDFCRLLLQATRADLTREQRQRLVGSWSYRFSGMGDTSDWHGPDNYYWHGNACCAYSARQQGISAWLAEKYPDTNDTSVVDTVEPEWDRGVSRADFGPDGQL